MPKRLPLLGFLLVAVSCDGSWLNECKETDSVDTRPILSRAKEERAAWSAKHPTRYTILTDVDCFCGPNWALSAVSDDTVTAYFPPDRYEDQPSKGLRVEDFFDDIDSIARSHPWKMKVAYQTTMHYPRSIYTDGKACWSDDYADTHVELVRPDELAGVDKARRCTAETLGSLAGTWRIETAPSWLLALVPVTAAVTVAELTNVPRQPGFADAISDATVRLYSKEGTTQTISVALARFPTEPWCGAEIELDAREYPETAFSVQSDLQWVLWDPRVKEEPGSRNAQWRLKR